MPYRYFTPPFYIPRCIGPSSGGSTIILQVDPQLMKTLERVKTHCYLQFSPIQFIRSTSHAESLLEKNARQQVSQVIATEHVWTVQAKIRHAQMFIRAKTPAVSDARQAKIELLIGDVRNEKTVRYVGTQMYVFVAPPRISTIHPCVGSRTARLDLVLEGSGFLPSPEMRIRFRIGSLVVLVSRVCIESSADKSRLCCQVPRLYVASTTVPRDASSLNVEEQDLMYTDDTRCCAYLEAHVDISLDGGDTFSPKSAVFTYLNPLESRELSWTPQHLPQFNMDAREHRLCIRYSCGGVFYPRNTMVLRLSRPATCGDSSALIENPVACNNTNSLSKPDTEFQLDEPWTLILPLKRSTCGIELFAAIPDLSFSGQLDVEISMNQIEYTSLGQLLISSMVELESIHPLHVPHTGGYVLEVTTLPSPGLDLVSRLSIPTLAQRGLARLHASAKKVMAESTLHQIIHSIWKPRRVHTIELFFVPLPIGHFSSSTKSKAKKVGHELLEVNLRNTITA